MVLKGLLYLDLKTTSNRADGKVTMRFGVSHCSGVASDCRMSSKDEELCVDAALAILRGVSEVLGDETLVSLIWRGNSDQHHSMPVSELATAIREGQKLRLA